MFGIYVVLAVVCLVLAVMMFRNYAANRRPSRLIMGFILLAITLAGTVYTVWFLLANGKLF